MDVTLSSHLQIKGCNVIITSACWLIVWNTRILRLVFLVISTSHRSYSTRNKSRNDVCMDNVSTCMNMSNSVSPAPYYHLTNMHRLKVFLQQQAPIIIVLAFVTSRLDVTHCYMAVSIIQNVAARIVTNSH